MARIVYTYCLLLTASVLSSALIGPVQSSSYLDDYFLPTAKLALNKLQQSLAPAASSTPTEATLTLTTTQNTIHTASSSPNDSQYAAPSTTTTTSTSTPTTTTTSEPNKNEFIPLETRPRLVESESAQATDASTTVLSSSAATDIDPSSTVPNAPASEPTKATAGEADDESPAVRLVTGNELGDSSLPAAATETTPASTTTTSAPSSTTAELVVANELPALVVDGRPADDVVVRETEMDAVNAVDASIGFGSSAEVWGGASADSCYDEYGNARYCEPEFENVAFERPIEVSSECGSPPSRFCTAYAIGSDSNSSSSSGADQIRNCHICDAQHTKKRHPAAYLTDLNVAGTPTCWVSAPLSASAATTSGGELALRADNVSLTLNLDKKYELAYVSIQFCSPRPDSLAIVKSSDFGASWQPYQFYSSQCRQMYSRPMSGSVRSPADSRALCANSSGTSSARVAFSTLSGESGDSSRTASKSAPQSNQHDWATATNVRIVLDRHQMSWIHANGLVGAHQHSRTRPASTTSGSKLNRSEPADREQPEVASLTSPSDAYNYAVADLTVGGRCKCNGHAARCVHSANGRLECECRHNTAGRDCDRCAPFHFDRPWQRATQMDANPCQPCNCNGHSRKCRFDSELYQLSGKRSGGVCINCRDNTAGRHCHYCKEGFTRDHSKPMSDKEACKHCDCHPVGSLGRVCNQTTGQCPCKEGVTGLQCNRCAIGYQQSSSPSEPCIKLPENDINYEPSLAVEANNNEQAAPAAGDNGAPTAAVVVDPSSVAPLLGSGAGEDWPRRAPPSGTRAPKLGNEPDLAAASDEDEDQPAMSELQHRRRLKQQHYWRHRHNAYGGAKPRQRYTFADELEEAEAPLDEETRYTRPNYSSTRQRFPGEFRSQRRGNVGARARLVPELAGVDVAVDNGPYSDLDTGGYSSSLGGYAPANGGDLDAEDDDDLATTFNQIHEQARPRVYSLGRSRPHPQHQAGRRRGPPLQANEDHQVAPLTPVNCAECAMSGRKWGQKEFCHFHFAIKATILGKQVAEDWTRFDVEVVDIFKSPVPRSQTTATAGNYLDSMVQADEPVTPPMNRSLSTGSGGSVAEPQSPAAESAMQPHRLRVKSVQPIWVPTEDFSCKCPRLKLRTTYLLMGFVDANENSANSIQIDRQSIAIEWRTSLQERLVKYQRRHAKGRCNKQMSAN